MGDTSMVPGVQLAWRAALQTLRGLLLSAWVRADQILQESSMPSANGHGEVRQDQYPPGRHRARGAEPVLLHPSRGQGWGHSSVFLFIQGAPAPPGPPSSLSLHSWAHRIHAGGSGGPEPTHPTAVPRQAQLQPPAALAPGQLGRSLCPLLRPPSAIQETQLLAI